jgi:outer membrane protein assembly factor BamD
VVPAAAAGNAVVKPVGPVDNKPLPPVDKPTEAANQINDVKGTGPAQVSTGTTAENGKKKNKKAPYDSKTESSSKHKPKHGLKKLIPF